MFAEKNLIKLMKSCISKDETRPAMKGIYFHGNRKQALVTDGICALASRHLYQEELGGITLDPNNMSIIHKDFPKLDPILDFNKEKHKKGRWLIEKKHVSGDFKLYFYVENNEFKIGMDSREDYEFCIRAKLLKQVPEFGELDVYYREKLTPVYFDLKPNIDGIMDELFVAMPVKV